MRAYRDQHGFDFPILLDPEAKVIQEWGLLNEADGQGKLIPHPTVVILDAQGVVNYFLTETNYKLRPPSADLVERLRRLSE